MKITDSNTNLIPIDHIFDIRAYYDEKYTDYCATIGPKIKLLFDLLCGYGYESACPLTQIDKDTIEFSGPASNLILIYDKLMNSPSIRCECDKTREELVSEKKMIEDPYYRTILENGCSISMDVSKVTIRFHRL